MFIVLLGAPGSGKGTAGKIIAEDLKLAHISTGDLFRENLKNETELGKEAKQYMDKGELVPDEVTIKMLKERLKADDVENGAVLDGFPRTGVQAVSLDNMVFSPSKVEGICDKCGGELYQREDQKPEVVENRLKVYSESAEELINHYENAGILYNAKAGDKVGKTSYDVAKEVEEYINSNK